MRSPRAQNGPHERAIAAFSTNQRFFGMALVGPRAEPLLRPYRVDRSELGMVTLAAWVERSIVRHAPELVVLVACDSGLTHELDLALVTLVRRIADRRGLPLLDLRVEEIARQFGIDDGETATAICRHLARGDAEIAKLLGPRRGGPRSERARYWETAVVALAGVYFVVGAKPQDRP